MPLRFQPSRGAAGLSLNALSRGPSGAAATIAVGSTTTGAEGTSASVSNSGSPGAATFNFTIPRGAVPAVGFNFDTGTADADPGAGEMAFNHATPASVTTIYFDNTDRGGNTVTTWLDSFDDSTSTVKGVLVIVPAATPSAPLIYSVSGTVTDGTGYRKVTVTHIAGTTLPSGGAHLAVAFYRTGDKGTDGEMAGPGVSVDGEIALYDGIDGATLKRASTTGLLKATSGVLAQAVAGTDYYNPGGTDVALADGGTGASLADPGADRIVFWDESANTITWLQLSGLTITDTTIAVDAATTDAAGKVELATTAEALTGTDTARAVTPAGLAAATIMQGKHTIYVPAQAMVSRTTNGAAAGSTEMSTNKQMVKTLDFDTTTQEFAQFSIRMPVSWNEGTVSFIPVWSHPSTTTNFGVVWALEAVAVGDDDALDASWGTAGTSTDTGGTTNDIYAGPESSAITINGTPAAGDTVYFQVKRNVSDGSDNMAVDARLHGIVLLITINAATDA